MPLSNEQIHDIIAKALSTNAAPVPKAETAIDRSLSFLPVGSKTLIGWLGTLASGGAAVIAENPGLLDFSSGDWKGKLASLIAFAFVALAGVGGISKWQRFIVVAQQGNDLLGQVLQKIQDRGEP